MGLHDMTPGDDEEDDEQQNVEKVSYIYIRHPQHPSNGPNYDREAYGLVSKGGVVREAMKRSGDYEDIHEFGSHLMTAVGLILSEGDFSKMWEILQPTDEHIMEYLNENPEVKRDVIRQISEEQSEQESDEGAEESA